MSYIKLLPVIMKRRQSVIHSGALQAAYTNMHEETTWNDTQMPCSGIQTRETREQRATLWSKRSGKKIAVKMNPLQK